MRTFFFVCFAVASRVRVSRACLRACVRVRILAYLWPVCFVRTARNRRRRRSRRPGFVSGRFVIHSEHLCVCVRARGFGPKRSGRQFESRDDTHKKNEVFNALSRPYRLHSKFRLTAVAPCFRYDLVT